MHRQPNKINSQSGFSPIVLVLILVFILALGLGSWYIWQRNHKIDDQANSAQTEQATEANDASDGASYEAEEYLVIQELGIKIPLTDEISGAYYTFHSDELVEYVSLYDSGFDQLENANEVSCGGENKYQIYSVSRAKPENVAVLNEFAGPEYKSFPFTDEYMFGGLGAHQAPPPCSDLNFGTDEPYQEDENILRVANDKEQAFNQSFNNLQPIN